MKIHLLIFTLFLFSCGNAIDVEIVKQELIEADKQFSQLSLEKGKNRAFLEYMDEKVTILTGNIMPIEGRTTVAQQCDNQPNTSYILKWRPINATASKSCDLGYT